MNRSKKELLNISEPHLIYALKIIWQLPNFLFNIGNIFSQCGLIHEAYNVAKRYKKGEVRI